MCFNALKIGYDASMNERKSLLTSVIYMHTYMHAYIYMYMQMFGLNCIRRCTNRVEQLEPYTCISLSRLSYFPRGLVEINPITDFKCLY